MNQIREIKGCGTFLDGFLFSLRSEDENSGGGQVFVDDIEQFKGIDIWTYQDFLDLGKPFVHFAVIFADIAVLLVRPVGCNTFLCNVIHSPCPDLNLDPDTGIAHQCAVESFISIALRVLDPIAYPLGLISVKSCYYGEYVVALISLRLLVVVCGSRIEDDSHCIEVVDLLEGYLLGNHLVPDGVRCLYPLLYLEIETCLFEGIADRTYEFVNAFLLVGHVPVDLVVIGIRLLVPQPDVFHFGLHLVQSEPVGQRYEYEHGLAQNLVTLVFRHEFDGAAVVQTVRQLYQHDTYVIVESQEDTLEILSL